MRSPVPCCHSAFCLSRRWVLGALVTALVVFALPALAQEGSGPSGIIDDGWRRVEWHIGGIDVGEHHYSGSDRCWTAPGTVTSTTVTFSGVLHAEVPSDLVTTASMSAYLLNQTTGEQQQVAWPDSAKGEVGDLGKPGALSHDLPFSFSVQVSPGDRVWATANINECGGVCDLTALCLFFDPAPDTIASAPTTTPTLEPRETSTPEPKESPSWVGVVIGAGVLGVVAVAGLAAAVAVTMRSRGRKAQGAAKYILQLSDERIELSPGESRSFTVTAWRVTPEGGYVPAPEASIQVQVPSQASWLQVAPLTGQGSLQCGLSLSRYDGEVETSLTIIGVASGARVTASVQVRARVEYEIVFS